METDPDRVLTPSEQRCRGALARNPRDAEALHELARLALSQARPGVAAKLARSAVSGAPQVADFHNTLGAALGQLCRHEEAVDALLEAIRLRCHYPEAEHNLGMVFMRRRQWEQAAEAFGRAHALSPGDNDTLRQLAAALLNAERFEESAKANRSILERMPGDMDAVANLARAYGSMGRADVASRWQRRLVDEKPGTAADRSNLLFMMLHRDDVSVTDLRAEHLNCAGHVSATLQSSDDTSQTYREFETTNVCCNPAGTLTNDSVRAVRDSARIRVGYISPDFRRHPVAAMIEPMLESHAGVDVFCYSDVPHGDATTRRLAAMVHAWRAVAGKPDEDVARMIRDDRIDVLVELAGHTAGNRLTLLGRRPAAVQVTYHGYPFTTGLTSVDWRISDETLDPPGVADACCVERIWRLPGCSWCYRPAGPDEPLPDVNALPAKSLGQVTFAALNRLLKATPTAIRLWARVLAAVPGSRLLVRGFERDDGVRTLLAENGIDLSRVAFTGQCSRAAYCRQYLQADISLDSYPYVGQTTTCDSLSMGVPVVTLAGQTHVSRAGLSALTAVGLPQFAARTGEEYVDIAAGLASDLDGLAALRMGLREPMRRSPLMNAAALVLKLEDAYRGMWLERCGARLRR